MLRECKALLYVTSVNVISFILLGIFLNCAFGNTFKLSEKLDEKYKELSYTLIHICLFVPFCLTFFIICLYICFSLIFESGLLIP